jgi:SNF2 family DNA or RNA helicase
MAMNKDKDAMSLGSNMPQSGSQTPASNSKTETDDMDDLAALMGGVSVQNKNCDVCQIELSSAEARDGASRCNECNEDLQALKAKGKKTKKSTKKSTKTAKSTKREVKPESQRPARSMRNRRVLLDSDDEDEGEWIGEGTEQHIDLGKAGGTDDEDAEGGGDTLGSIDSVTDDEQSQSGSEEEQEDESDDDTLPIISGLAPSHKASHKPSTKIRHLLRILHKETPEHKTIVFSQFTSMLDLIEPHLKHASIEYVRYDGSMRPDAREASLNSLKTNPKTRVLLCSLKCGSLGLNLTAASRVVIVEPFWNPFVEEQAIDRVHRLNQPVDVKVFRLTVRNTVEEKILALQEKKRQLAAAAIEGGKAVGKLSMQDIMQLFRRDAEVGANDEDAAFAEKFGGDAKLLDGSGSGSGSRGGSRHGSSTPPERPVQKKGVARRPEHSVYGRRW